MTDRSDDFRSFFELVPIPVVLSNLKTGTIVDVNAALCDMTKHERDELIGHTSIELGFANEPFRSRYVEELQTRGEVRGMEVKIPNKNGEVLDGLMFARPITRKGDMHILATFLRGSTGETSGAVAPDAQLESIRSLALTTMHDLNNLLTAVGGHAELLKTTINDSDQRFRDISAIVNAVHLAAELTSQLLDVSRRQRGACACVDIHELISGVAEAFEPTFPDGVRVHLALRAEKPRVLGDATRLRRVLLNLLSNARDAMDTGGQVTIATCALDDAARQYFAVPEGEYLSVRVSDTGGGIEPAFLHRVFEPFFTTKGPRGGTGLGLRIVAEIVKNHGGDVRVGSTPGQGATFEIVLPSAIFAL
jgi:two-component system, cell cycle sensor histidine kinase and response regulator CckA